MERRVQGGTTTLYSGGTPIDGLQEGRSSTRRVKTWSSSTTSAVETTTSSHGWSSFCSGTPTTGTRGSRCTGTRGGSSMTRTGTRVQGPRLPRPAHGTSRTLPPTSDSRRVRGGPLRHGLPERPLHGPGGLPRALVVALTAPVPPGLVLGPTRGPSPTPQEKAAVQTRHVLEEAVALRLLSEGLERVTSSP